MTTTWRDALTWARSELVDYGEHELRWVIEVASGRTQSELYDALDEPVPVRAAQHLGEMLARRRKGEPLQYVLGRWPFRTLDLFIDERVLIPRPETEVVAEHAITIARSFTAPTVVDLGTGSGALALSVAAEVDDATVWATDASDDALAVARANLAGIGRPATRVRLATGWWFDALPPSLRGAAHVIVSNPPYVADEERGELPEEVRDYEPAAALFAGPTGLEALSVVIAGAGDWLVDGGALVCEIAPDQRTAVLALASAHGFRDATVAPDLSGRDRVLVARR